jgi:cytochrome c biogenesis protein CcdA
MRRRFDSVTLPATAHWLLPLAVALIALAGYAGYLLYPRFDLPAPSGVGLLVLAGAAGVAAFFSPCSFPLLVTLLSASAEPRDGSRRRVGPVAFAVSMALGAALFLAVLGVAIAAGGSTLFSGITFLSTEGRVIRAVVGGSLTLLGLMQLGIVAGPDFHRLETFASRFAGESAPKASSSGSLAWSTSYGVGYVFAGVG